MKNLCILLFLLSALSITAQKKITDSFEYKVIYEQKAQLNKEDSTFVKTEPMVLLIGKETSSFSSRAMAVEHTLKIQGNSGHTSRAAVTEFLYMIIKSSKAQKMYYTRNVLYDKFYYEQDLNIFDWKILPEFKTYKNYKCQKATTTFAGRDYIAWFTMDIPISEGPYKFNGLPGLIVEIHDANNHYSFKMEGFEKLSKKLDFKLNFREFIKVDKAKLNEIIYESINKRFANKPNSNITISPKTRKFYQKVFRDRYEKRNNPIEIE